MKFKKTIILLIAILTTFTFLNHYSFIVKAAEESEVLYNNSTFNICGDKLNLIINTINIDDEFLFVDSYLFNNSKTPITSIQDFRITLVDNYDTLVFDELFNEIPIKEILHEHSGVKLVLSIPLEDVNLEDIDFSSINYNFNYNYRSNLDLI